MQDDRYIYPEDEKAFPHGKPSGRCPECSRPLDDPIHHFIVSSELLGKSTDQGNRYYHVRKPEPPSNPIGDVV